MNDYQATMRDHLTHQKARAVDTAGSCRYRATGVGGKLMCAVGCLIPDAQYYESFEDKLLSDVLNIVGIPKSNYWTLLCWQAYHDRRARFSNAQFCYEEWLDGDESQSPAAFYEFMQAHPELRCI